MQTKAANEDIPLLVSWIDNLWKGGKPHVRDARGRLRHVNGSRSRNRVQCEDSSHRTCLRGTGFVKTVLVECSRADVDEKLRGDFLALMADLVRDDGAAPLVVSILRTLPHLVKKLATTVIRTRGTCRRSARNVSVSRSLQCSGVLSAAAVTAAIRCSRHERALLRRGHCHACLCLRLLMVSKGVDDSLYVIGLLYIVNFATDATGFVVTGASISVDALYWFFYVMDSGAGITFLSSSNAVYEVPEHRLHVRVIVTPSEAPLLARAPRLPRSPACDT